MITPINLVSANASPRVRLQTTRDLAMGKRSTYDDHGLAEAAGAAGGLWSAGKAAFGYGETGAVGHALSSVNAFLCLFQGVHGWLTPVTADQVSDSIRLSRARLGENNAVAGALPQDAARFARKLNTRGRIYSTLMIANGLATANAAFTGHPTAGVAALALKTAAFGYGLWCSEKSVRDHMLVGNRAYFAKKRPITDDF